MTWRDRAACAGSSIDFFSDHPDKVRQAKQICHDCPVAVECLQWARAEQFEFGVFGGMTPADRRKSRVMVGDDRVPAPASRGPKPKAIAHGTNAGYKAHQRRNIDACQACLDAHAQYKYEANRRQREWKRAKQAEKKGAA